MPLNEPFPGGNLLQCVIEWQIDGALDGTTPAPGLEVANNILVQRPTPLEYPFIIEVDDDAGLFDPDAFGGVASYADRYVQWIRIFPASAQLPGQFFVGIVDASGLVPSVLGPAGGPFAPYAEITAVFTPPARYQAAKDFVPQGSVIQIAGFAAPPPGARHIVQIGIRAATTLEHDALLEQASCCLFDPG
jgi:hypothetical protein